MWNVRGLWLVVACLWSGGCTAQRNDSIDGLPDGEILRDPGPPAAASSGAETPGNAPETVAPADSEAEEEAATPPVASLDDPGPQTLETARRALLQGRQALADKQYAQATEDFEAAQAALASAREALADDPEALALIDEVAAALTDRIPGLPTEADELIAKLDEASAPVPPAPLLDKESAGAPVGGEKDPETAAP